MEWPAHPPLEGGGGVSQNVPSVLHPSRCLEKREISTVLEFDEIRRGS